jgi:4-diphosphocytidyl-2-C-methyl-D-erythritol kinase
VAFCDVGDVLHVRSAADVTMKITGRFSEGLSAIDNSVMQAARMLQVYAGVTHGAAIDLEKHLPIASGIGGGSGDAANILIALNALWKCGLSASELMQLALPLGADVPVCIHGNYCVMEGIGEQITPLPSLPDDYYAVLVNPLIAVSTPMIFKALAWGENRLKPSPFGRGQGEGVLTTELIPCLVQKEHNRYVNMCDLLCENPHPALSQRERVLEWLSYLRAQQNDLQEVAIQHYPVIADIVNALSVHPVTLLARLSGSGATCFALCEGKNNAEQLLQEMQRTFPDFWVACGKLG